MKNANNDEVRTAVREHYGKLAGKPESSSCSPGCCAAPAPDFSRRLGYSDDELAAVPEGANLGLGCGNPQAIAALKPGETVLDLGSGAGFDCFLAARQVGPSGRVIGVDMTTEMIGKARANAEKLESKNIEFRLGEIEHLPVENGSIDVILSNCVVNLAPDKERVYREAFRVLRAGGRLAISDVVALREMPESLRDQVEAMTGCIAGAARVGELERMLEAAGFVDVQIVVRTESREVIRDWFPGSGAEDVVASATIEARKPGRCDLLRAELLRGRRGNDGMMTLPERTSWQELETRLRPFIARRVSAAADVDDILQEVLLRVHRGLGGLEDEGRFTAWIYQIARNAITDHLRARARMRAVDASTLDIPAPAAADDEEIEAVVAQYVAFFVALLSSPYREALTLTELEGRTQREAAELLGVSLSGMKSRVQRGRMKLREMLESCCRIALDARGRIISCEPRAAAPCLCNKAEGA